MKYLTEIIYKGIYIVIPFMFIAEVIVANRTHDTESTQPSPEQNLHPIAIMDDMNWERNPLKPLVDRLSQGDYRERQLANTELSNLLIADYRRTSESLSQILNNSEISLSPEARRRIERLLSEANVDWSTIFNTVRANVQNSRENRSVQEAHNRISRGLNPDPAFQFPQFSEHVKGLGYKILQLENTPHLSGTLVVERDNQLFRIHFMGKGDFSVERVSRTGENQYSRANVSIDFNNNNLFTPLQRASLPLRQDQNFPPFSTPSPNYNPFLSESDSLGSNFITETANYLRSITSNPTHQAAITAEQNRILATQRIPDKRRE